MRIYAGMNYVPEGGSSSQELERLLEARIDGLHFKVNTGLRGHPYTPEVIKRLSKRLGNDGKYNPMRITPAVSISILLEGPSADDFARLYAAAGASRVAFSYSQFSRIPRTLIQFLKQAKEVGKCKTGVAFNSDYAPVTLPALIDTTDYYHLRCTDGDPRREIEAVKDTKRQRHDNPDLEFFVECDFDLQSAPRKAALIAESGADVLVVGRALFESEDYGKFIQSLRGSSVPSRRAGYR